MQSMLDAPDVSDGKLGHFFSDRAASRTDIQELTLMRCIAGSP
jgi:hypothetical protein